MQTERFGARIDAVTRALVLALSRRLGVSESAVFRLAIREMAERHGVPVPDVPANGRARHQLPREAPDG